MLFSTIDEIREKLKISSSVDFEVLKPILETVDREFLRPVLGAEMHDKLLEFYNAPPDEVVVPEPDPPVSPTLEQIATAMAKLLKLAQTAEIHLAYWFGFDLLNIAIMNDGFKRTETEKVKGLFKYQEDNLKTFFKSAGFNGLDSMLEYLDGPDKACFPEFHNNETGQQRKLMFIPRTDIFNQYYYIGQNRLLFMRLKQHMQIVEDMKIKLVLGDTNFNFIKTEMVKATPDPKVVAILPLIRNVIPYFSTALLMEETASDLTDKGLFFDSITSNGSDHSNHTPSTEARIAAMIQRNKNMGNHYLQVLKSYLLNHSDDWNNYSQPRHGLPNRDNTGKKTFWA
ncbi:MAG: DUF6712 family protein [Bacteroidales bacterium]